MSRLVDALMAIPALIFSLLLLTIFGTSVLTLIADHRGGRCDARLPPGAVGGAGHRRHGLRRGRQTAGRRHAGG